MVKNRKGFTLVELLAAIVILGILAVFSVPIIVGMLDKSRNKMYVDDTKKLISKVEYQMRSSSNEIDIPDPDECIVISLVYLDDSDFDNPPNNGKYQRNNSFVVVKNHNGTLEYSATLIEKYKGNYRGVELTTSDELYSSRGIKHVKNFKESDLLNIDRNVTKDEVKSFINGSNGFNGYVTKVYQVYNTPASKGDNVLTGDSFTPKFEISTLLGTETYNNLNPQLTLKVSDADTPTNQLTVYLGYKNYDKSNPIPYGNGDAFKQIIPYEGVFDGVNYINGGSVTLYVMVEDPDHNVVKRKLEYEVHKNLKPEIDKKDTFITKRGNDIVNMPTALVKLSVSDDMDSLNELRVCLVESDTNEFPSDKCVNDNEFSRYSDVFMTNNTKEYSFKNPNRDGSTHYLKAFVKDKYGLTTSHVFEPYVYSTNQKPKFKTTPIITPIPDNKVELSNRLAIKFMAEDDLGPSNLTVVVSDGTTTSEYKYSDEADYELWFDKNKNPLYDGTSKTITVKLIDSEGGEVSWNDTYTLYKNKKPDLSFQIVPTELPCINQDMCSDTDSGNLKVNLFISASDDIDDDGNLNICVTENKDSCTNYVKYSDYMNNPYVFNFSGTYDGKERTVYVTAKDSYNTTEKVSQKYTVYKNKKPVIEKFEVTSVEDANGIDEGGLKLKFNIVAKDDFDSTENLSFKLSENGTDKITGTNNFATYNDTDTEYTVDGTYDGKSREIVVTVTDKDGESASVSYNYDVRENQLPSAYILSMESVGNVCNNPNLCVDSEGGNNNIKFDFTASDDMDNITDLKFCLSENENGCTDKNTYTSYNSYYDSETGIFKNVPYTFTTNSTNPFDGSIKKLYVFVLDKLGSTNKAESEEYALYENKSPVILQDATLTTNNSNPNFNELNATYTSDVEDDIDNNQLQIKYCRKTGSSAEVCTNYENYTKTKVLDSSFFGQTEYNGAVFTVKAVAKDKYGLTTDLNEIKYTIHKDEKPAIDYFDVYYKIADDESKVTLYYTFLIKDPYDTYSVCINSENSCSNYTGTYDGNNTQYTYISTDYARGDNLYNRVVQYDNAIKNSEDEERVQVDKIKMYLFGKDSQDKINSASADVNKYSVCTKADESTKKYEYLDLEPGEDGKIVIPGGDKINPSDNVPISMTRCSGKCYANSSVNNGIVTYYKRKITYKDKFDSSVSCSNEGNGPNIYEANCSFKDCFLKNNSYVRNAIGIQHYVESTNPDEPAWYVTIGGENIACYGYYKLYRSSYTQYAENITLTEIENEKICDTALDRGYYNYDPNASNPYVRIDDSIGGE